MADASSDDTWFEDDAVFDGEVRAALREESPAPRVPGCSALSEIGRGGQGVVYAATQDATRRRVAVKVLLDLPGRTRSSRQRFARELEIVASLKDARLVQVFEGGTTDDGRPFVVMEHVAGVRPDDAPVVRAARAAGFARPAADAALALFADVCEGVDVAHRRGVIHRDLKPANILVDEAGVPRVLDFGLAKSSGLAAEGFATTAGARFVGSLPWASPEAAEGRHEAVDVRSDVYGLGATLYHLITGRPPCATDGDLRQALAAVVERPPVPPSKLDPRCDRDLEAVVLRALEKDPARRYATAGEMARDLRRLLAGEPIEARRETAWRALTKAARRRRRFAIVAGVVACASLAVLALVVSLWRTAEEESARATDESNRANTASARATDESRRATEESHRATAEARRARESLDFFLDTLGSVDPARDGADAKLAEALDRVSSELDRRFGDSEPEVRLRFRARLRDLYLRLGRYDRAVSEAELASALAEEIDAAPGTPEMRERWVGERKRAVALYKMRRGTEALAAFKGAQAALTQAFGARDPDALAAQVGVGQVLNAFRKLDEAEVELRAVEAATFGATTTEEGGFARATALDLLAAISEQRGRPADAEAPQTECVRLYASIAGEMAQETLGARSNLGNMFLTLGRDAEAVAVLEPTAAAFQAGSGAEHPQTLAARHNLGVAYLRVGRGADADRELRAVHEIRLRRLGPDAPDTLLTLHEVAFAASARGDKKEFERLLRLLLDARRRRVATEPESFWTTANNLAVLLRDEGRPTEAEPLHAEIVPAADLALGADHWLAAVYRGDYGITLTDLDRCDEAKKLLESSASVLEAKLGPDHSHTKRIRAALSRAVARAATRPDSRKS